MLRDQIIDLVDRRDDGMHILPDCEPQILHRLRVQRIDQGDLQHVVLVPQRECTVELRQAGGQELEQLGGRRKILQVHVLRPDRVREGLVVAFLGDRLIFHEHMAQSLPRPGDLLQNIFLHALIHESLFDENCQRLFCVHGWKIIGVVLARPAVGRRVRDPGPFQILPPAR